MKPRKAEGSRGETSYNTTSMTELPDSTKGSGRRLTMRFITRADRTQISIGLLQVCSKEERAKNENYAKRPNPLTLWAPAGRTVQPACVRDATRRSRANVSPSAATRQAMPEGASKPRA